MRNNEKTVKASSKLMSIPDDIDGLLLEVKGQEVQESGLPEIDDLTPPVSDSKNRPFPEWTLLPMTENPTCLYGRPFLITVTVMPTG